MSAAAPLLAALLRAALPGLRALDLGLPAPPALFPWLPGTLCGVADADADALPPAEAALLRRFRHADGRQLVGFDRAADAALFAGAPAAWDDAPQRLVRLAATPPLGDLPAPDTLLLVPPGAEVPAGPHARILLLLGAGEAVERHDLLVPPPRLGAIHAALGAAAEGLASAAGGDWSARALTIATDMASVALLPQGARTHRPFLSIAVAALVHDAPALAGPGGLEFPDAGRVRLLLGAPPRARLRVVLRGESAPRAALFADGRRLPSAVVGHGSDETSLEAEAWPPGAAGAAVLGVAVPAPTAGAALLRLELLP